MNEIKLKFIFDAPGYLNDVQDIVRGFSPFITVDEEAADFLQAGHGYSDGIFFVNITSSFTAEKSARLSIGASDASYKKLTKRLIKNELYDYLSSFLNIRLPYGSLTGVRPTKLFYELSAAKTDNPVSVKGVVEILKNEFRVDAEKAELIRNVVANQKGIYESSLENADIFVNVPFCPSRCSYCSFISSEIFRVKKLIPDYALRVAEEIEKIKEVIFCRGMKIRSVYVGGGTPTSVGDYLDIILSPLKGLAAEFTVEAGRPDTIDEGALALMKKNGVTRISVNPQSFNQKTLDIIGRAHKAEDTVSAYYLAKEYGFDVNMDLIALLPSETAAEFRYSVDRAAELRPENITVHTFSRKRGAVLASEALAVEPGLAKEMTDYAYKKLYESGYNPYYMYRQKNMADNLENTGFCLPGKACIYNVDMMEETNTIFGAGANAMTKLLSAGGAITRKSNPKGIKEYLERFGSIISAILTVNR